MPAEKRIVVDDPPPFLGEWRWVYLAIIVYLVVIISLFYLFGRAFA